MATLFGKAKSTINEHIKNIFKEQELEENSVVRNFRTTASDGKKYATNFYNLDVIISVGYRVKSLRGTEFHKWATQRLKEYIIKGFTIDDERLKGNAGGNYWRELLERIRDIRSSEKVLYRQVLEKSWIFLQKCMAKGVLQNAGKISHKKAIEKAEKEYQVKTLSPVKVEYLENVKKLKKDISKK